MNNRLLLALAAAAFAICLAAIWFLQRQPHAVKTTPPPVAASTPAPLPAPEVARPETRPFSPPSKTAASAPRPVKEDAKPPADWEMKIDQVLRAEVDESATAQLLINLLPTLPAEGQAEAAQHISNLLLDKDYGRILPLVKNSNLSEEVLDVFVTDLMNRDDAVKLPVLLEIAKIPNHPHREESLSDLQIFLDEDYGADWAKWNAAMKSYLAKQAAEEAADAAGTPPPAVPGQGVPRSR